MEWRRFVTYLSNDPRTLPGEVTNSLAVANIASQLHAHTIRGHLSNSVTLKSRSGVTEGHWKRHHSIDHIRLTIVELFDVDYRDL